MLKPLDWAEADAEDMEFETKSQKMSFIRTSLK